MVLDINIINKLFNNFHQKWLLYVNKSSFKDD